MLGAHGVSVFWGTHLRLVYRRTRPAAQCTLLSTPSLYTHCFLGQCVVVGCTVSSQVSAACCMGRQNPRGSKPLGSEDRSHSLVRQSFPRACALGVRLASHTPVVLRAMHMSPKPQAHCHAVARAEPAERVRGGRWMRTTYPVASVSGLPLRVWRNIHVAEHKCMREAAWALPG